MPSPTLDSPLVAADASFRAVQRQLAALIPEVGPPSDRETLLEVAAISTEPPRLIETELIEPGPMRAHAVQGEPEVRFAAFLDGTQASKVLHYFDGLPIVHGTVAAVIRERRDRRLFTWTSPLVQRRVYVPRAALSAGWNVQLDRLGVEVVDTSTTSAGESLVGAHPFAYQDAAIHRVQKDRERAEQELAEDWCRMRRDPLFIDGGISGSDFVASSECAVGVVKSHRTLYAMNEGLRVVLRLARGERSSVFRVTSPKRQTVASWYLRLRDPAGHDPMWGLVRVELSNPARADEQAIGERANAVSRWILAEVSPLSLPDGRWDKMVYGIRDCEVFLGAIS